MLVVKTLHIWMVISWFAGLFYLPRIFVNLAMVPAGSQAERDRLLLMARSAAVQRQLNAAFAARTVHKRYEAVVTGRLEPKADASDAEGWQRINLPICVDWPNRPRRIIDPVHGKSSQTRWRVLELTDQTTRLALEPVTGRSHQLRVHLQAIGHPILGDALYAPAAVAAQTTRLLLHASGLRLLHPLSGEPLHLVSPAPF